MFYVVDIDYCFTKTFYFDTCAQTSKSGYAKASVHEMHTHKGAQSRRIIPHARYILNMATCDHEPQHCTRQIGHTMRHIGTG